MFRRAVAVALPFIVPPLLAIACRSEASKDDVPSRSRDSVDCPALASEAHRRVSLSASASAACSSDPDCTTVEEIDQCIGGCSIIVAASAKAAVQGALRAVDRDTCEQFAQASCPRPVASCRSVTPVCSDGRCRERAPAP